jgi:hypothetical protein
MTYAEFDDIEDPGVARFSSTIPVRRGRPLTIVTAIMKFMAPDLFWWSRQTVEEHL